MTGICLQHGVPQPLCVCVLLFIFNRFSSSRANAFSVPIKVFFLLCNVNRQDVSIESQSFRMKRKVSGNPVWKMLWKHHLSAFWKPTTKGIQTAGARSEGFKRWKLSFISYFRLFFFLIEPVVFIKKQTMFFSKLKVPGKRFLVPAVI